MSGRNKAVKQLLAILYEVILWVIALIAIPKTLYNFFVYKKYRKSFLARLGWQYPAFRQDSQMPYIWIHAVSIGETKAIARLARELKQKFEHVRLVISSTTETGHAEAKRSLPFADYHIYLPFDFNWIVRSVLSKVSPQLVILCESDLWYNFLRQAKRQGAQIALVNGKISERSMRRFHYASFFSRRLLDLFDVICLQNTLYRDRFLSIEAPVQKLSVTGNLKLDEDYPHLSEDEIKRFKEQLGIQSHHFVLAIGSSHHPEENALFDVLHMMWKQIPHLKVILAPRHAEKFREVAALLERKKITFARMTNLEKVTGQEQLILVDTMGKLRNCYQVCDVALVAGSYTSKIGGHNILEPCWYGKPVIFGPYMHTQVELVRLVQQYGAGVQATLDQLPQQLEHWFNHPAERAKIGQQGLCLIEDVKGSTARTLSVLAPLLANLNRQIK